MKVYRFVLKGKNGIKKNQQPGATCEGRSAAIFKLENDIMHSRKVQRRNLAGAKMVVTNHKDGRRTY